MLPPLLVLFSWPVVGLVLFRTLHLPLACLVTVVGGFLFLPEETVLDLPGLTLDKHSVPILTALCLALIFGQRDTSSTRPEGLIPRHRLALVLLILLAAGGLMTALTNSDTIRIGWRSLQGHRCTMRHR